MDTLKKQQISSIYRSIFLFKSRLNVMTLDKLFGVVRSRLQNSLAENEATVYQWLPHPHFKSQNLLFM